MPFRLIHTADAHLGAKFLALGKKGAEQREDLVCAFEAVCDLAVSERADVLLIAGDLFDSGTVPASLLDRVASRLQELTDGGVLVFVTPGTHDPYSAASPYASPQLSGIEGLHVFSSEQMEKVEPRGLDCAVFGNANMKPFENRHPLSGFRASSDRMWKIGMTHASFEIPDVSEDSYVVTPSEIASSGLDYLALGHVHSMSSRSSGGVTAYYSGSPEIVRMQKGDYGYALLVVFDETVSVRPLRVSSKQFVEATVRAESADEASVARLLRSEASKRKLLRLLVEGVRGAEFPDVDSIVAEHAGDFFFVSVTDRSFPSPSAIDPGAYPDEGAIAAFLSSLELQLRAAAETDKEEIREAMRLGVSLLKRGGSVED